MIFCRPLWPMALRLCSSSISVFRACSHSAGVSATNPLVVLSTISALMPTGDTTAGTPRAMYWRALKPHLPFAQMSSVNGMMPMSKRSRSGISCSLDQGIKLRVLIGRSGFRFAITTNSILPGYCSSSCWITGMTASMYFNVECVPVHPILTLSFEGGVG